MEGWNLWLLLMFFSPFKHGQHGLLYAESNAEGRVQLLPLDFLLHTQSKNKRSRFFTYDKLHKRQKPIILCQVDELDLVQADGSCGFLYDVNILYILQIYKKFM